MTRLRSIVLSLLCAALLLAVFLRTQDTPTSVPTPMSTDYSDPSEYEDASGTPAAEARPVSAAPESDDELGTAADATGDDASSWPPNMEDRLWEYFAHVEEDDIVSINSVECTETSCEVEFASSEVNPQHVGAFSDLYDKVYEQGWNVQQSSIGLREIAPGVRVYVLSMSHVQIDTEALRRAREEERQRLREQQE